MTRELGLLTGTRAFGKMTPDSFPSMVGTVITNAKPFGEVLVVTQTSYPEVDSLKDFSLKHGGQIRVANATGPSPAAMCNEIVKFCYEHDLPYFAIVSGDLAGYLPSRIPKMLEYLRASPTLASVGVAIQNVHDFGLLEKVRLDGNQEVYSGNFATIFHNNAFSVNRIGPEVGKGRLTLPQRLFPAVVDSGALGSVNIAGKEVSVGGNEEIALALMLLGAGTSLDVLFLAGEDLRIVRDKAKELSTLDEKVQRRVPVAAAYQQHFGINDEVLNEYLRSHYRISFD